MLYSDDIPPEVSINEVIELSKKYSNDKAPKFINGILDTALKDLMKEGKIRKTGKAVFNRKNGK
jgi:N utilization substance protein B